MHCRNLILRVSSNEDQSSNEYLGFLRLGESENDLKHRNAFCVHALTWLTRLLQLRTHSESFRVSRGDCYLFVPATLTRHHGNIWKYIIQILPWACISNRDSKLPFLNEPSFANKKLTRAKTSKPPHDNPRANGSTRESFTMILVAAWRCPVFTKREVPK